MKKRLWCFLSLFVFAIIITLGTSYAPNGQSAEIQKKSKIESKQHRPPNKLERRQRDKERYFNLLSSDDSRAELAVYSSEVELVGMWPYGACRASALDTSRNIALIGSGLALQVLDISTPSSPSAIGEVAFDEKPNVIAISGNYAYVCAQDWYTGLSMLKVIDITDPTTPTEINEVSFSGWGASIDISSNILCVAAEMAGLKIFDLTNPATPTEVGTYTADGNWVYEVALWNNYALIVNEYYDDPNLVHQMRVVNIASPGSPVLTGTYQAAVGYPISGLDVVASGIAYTTELDNMDWTGSNLTIIDVASDPAVPAILGSYEDTLLRFQGVKVQGDYAYVYDYWDCALTAIDISDPSSPTLEGWAMNGCGFDGMDLSGSYVGISAGSMGFELYDLSDPANPSYVATFETPDDVDDVVVSGDYAYLGNKSSGLRILDVSDLANPSEVGLCDTVLAHGRIAVSGNYAYCVAGWAELYVVDVSTPSAPTQVGNFYDGTWETNGVSVQGDYAYLVGTEWTGATVARMDIYDISTPTSPVFQGTYICADPTYDVRMVAVSDHYAYIPVTETDYSAGWEGPALKIIDVLDPTAPTEVGSFKPTEYGGRGGGVAVRGDHAFLTSLPPSQSFRTIDISDPTSPSEIASIGSSGQDIKLSGSYAYLGDLGGLTLVDISDPTNPVEAGYYFDSVGGTLDVSNGNHAYCTGSLVILKNLLAPAVELTSPSPWSTVSNTVALSAEASHTTGIAQIDFYVDGVLEGTDTTSPYSHPWNSRSVANGLHSIRARATNNDGKSSDSEVNIVVDNVALFRLSIAAGAGGTTDPVPGEHDYPAGTPVEVEAIPDNSGYVFSHWTGDVPSGHENDNPVTITVDANKSITANFTTAFPREDLLGTWGSGVWCRDAEMGSWIKIATTADPIAAGDLDGDGLSDLVGVWAGGLWVKYSSTGGWKRLSSPPLPTAIACGDFNGDGRDDVVGSWPSGTFYRDTLGSSWVYVSSPADALAAGDLDGDGTDDIIGAWSNGLWVKYSSGTWGRLCKPLPTDMAVGDMNADGRDDVLGTWSSGTFYLDTLGGSWVYVSTPAVLVGAGDLDGDGKDDLIGTWSGMYVGLWIKYSATMSWKKISLSVPSDLDAGFFRGGTWDSDKTK